MWNNKKQKFLFIYIKLQTYYHFKQDFQKVDILIMWSTNSARLFLKSETQKYDSIK